ncbi:reverse transcriptase domain-containing protein [Tanacetum coccineum]|uniref:Reverse transcriptase domain-containing protein n=1 Tax=Tanacetum coccineum TaxID=301880 RepID=A0ABQ5I2E0_9ASTR
MIVDTTSPTLTPFEGSDFILEEIEAELSDTSYKSGIDDADCDPEKDILLLKSIINSEPLSPTSHHCNYFPGDRKELKICEAKTNETSVDEPSESTSGMPSSWKLYDIKGINPEFCTHKILMEEDYTPAVQHQRRVNPKIHDVIKKEVEKLLDAGLIYPISDSPWVSPVHCVPKKGGFTVVENEQNELIPTRLVTGWRVCIDYRKLNEATRKDHFPLPFMDQMLERLAGNEYYCFLDGFSGYFQIPIDPNDQEKTTFTCPYGTFAYRRMPFGLCNAPGHVPEMYDGNLLHGHIEKNDGVEVFMDDFSESQRGSNLDSPEWMKPFELMCDEVISPYTNSTNSINTVSTPVSTAGPSFDNVVPSPPVNTVGPYVSTANAFEEHLFE